jgi:plasmid replication initiation protein
MLNLWINKSQNRYSMDNVVTIKDVNSSGELITKHNVVVRASYRLSLSEIRLVLMVIGQLNTDKSIKSNETVFTITASEYSRLFDVALNHSYGEIEEAANSMYDRTISLDEHTETRWIQTKSNYVKGEGYIKLRLSQDILPYIQELKSHFTAYYLDEIRNLKSVYSIRLFELFKSYLSVGEWNITVDEFKRMLDVSKEYRIDNVSSRVIMPAIDVINENTSLDVSYKKIKRGRVITGFSFTIGEKINKPLKAQAVQDDRSKALELLNNDSWVSDHAQIGESWAEARARLRKELETGKFSLAPTR